MGYFREVQIFAIFMNTTYIAKINAIIIYIKIIERTYIHNYIHNYVCMLLHKIAKNLF